MAKTKGMQEKDEDQIDIFYYSLMHIHRYCSHKLFYQSIFFQRSHFCAWLFNYYLYKEADARLKSRLYFAALLSLWKGIKCYEKINI